MQRIIAFLFLVISSSAHAQEDLLQEVREQFIQYQEKALIEKLFVHTSKDNFFVGETIFFKLYAVDGIFHRPLDLNKVAYFEVIASTNRPIAQMKIALKNGSGNGSLTLSDSLETGRYRIIAYTSWMKNFGPDCFFSKDISVINPLKRSVGNTKRSRSDTALIKFFPEGGSLVHGLTSKVAFQLTNSLGAGVRGNGFVVDETNDTLLRFQPLKFGIGSFSFAPQKGKSYRAIIATDHASVVAQLPVPLDHGYVVAVNHEINGNKITVKITSNNSDAVGKRVHFLIHSRQQIRKVLTSILDSGRQSLLVIPIDELDDGISHLTFFDDSLKPLAERLFFKRPERVMEIEVDGVKSSYTKRELVSVNLTAKKPDEIPAAANLSLSVFKIDDLQFYDSTTIASYILLTSDLKGTIENPLYYLHSNEGIKEQAIDNLMLTHGWSRFRWDDVLESKPPVTQVEADHEGMAIRARLTDNRDMPMMNANVCLSATSRNIQFYPATSNSQGIIQFYTKDLYGQTEILLQDVGTGSPQFTFNLLNPFTEEYPSAALIPYEVSKEQKDLISSYNIHTQVQRTFSTFSKAPVVVDSIPFFGVPDKSYELSDYVRFPQLKDVLKEYVFEVIVRKRDDKLRIFALDKVSQTYFENEPLVLLDGVPVFDTERIVSLPGDVIKRLDLINEKILYGRFVFNGIISLTSYSGKFPGIQVNPEAIVLDYEGLQIPDEFYSPPYDNAALRKDRLPDFRNVLLWSPNLHTTEITGKTGVTFFTSDLPGQYMGVINGITHDGLPGSAIFTFTVD
jgi:hypothetical protein